MPSSPLHSLSVPFTRQRGYTPIADYALIGNLHTVALISRDASIDWCCFPRFDSPSVFGALLDRHRGGRFQISPVDDGQSTQYYRGDTNILVTEFTTVYGARVEVQDFMPAPESGKGGLPAYYEIHRRVRCISGSAAIDIRCEPRFDYARRPARIFPRKYGLRATDGEDESLAISGSPGIRWFVDSRHGEARGRIRMSEGDSCWVVVRYNDDEVYPIEKYHSEMKLEATEAFWQEWAAGLQYEGPYKEAVVRSALALKLLFYEPSGAVVAAATTSLPEEIGGERNWDYRFCWLRDAAFTLAALDHLGQARESDHFMDYLKRVTRWSSGPLQIMYGIDGERRLEEFSLDHLEGFAGSSPVRIGNGAYDQLQLDVYGEVLDAAYLWSRRHPMSEGLWMTLARLATWVADHWRMRDSGIWEHRSGPQHYTFSKVMCWVALDRAVRLAQEFDLTAPNLETWQEERDAIYAEVMERGYNPEIGAFTQHYETTDLDASTLLIPQTGFLPGTDPRVVGTVHAILRELTEETEEFVYRYLNEDGLRGGEGVFSICTFWLADALILAGEIEHGERIFQRMLGHANHVGLYSEEIEPKSGEFLGNFPQAYTHIALINTALHLQAARDPSVSPPMAVLD